MVLDLIFEALGVILEALGDTLDLILEAVGDMQDTWGSTFRFLMFFYGFGLPLGSSLRSI